LGLRIIERSGRPMWKNSVGMRLRKTKLVSIWHLNGSRKVVEKEKRGTWPLATTLNV